MVGSRPRALQQELPCTLEVGHLRDGIPQALFIGKTLGHQLFHEGVRTDGRAEHLDASWTPDILAKRLHAGWWRASPVPRPRLAFIQAYACDVRQRFCQKVVDGAGALWLGHRIHVVEVCEEVLSVSQLGLHPGQRVVDS